MTLIRPFAIAVVLLGIAAGVSFAQDSASKTPNDGLPPGPGILADMIRNGEIDLGGKKSLALGDNFHRIHTRFMSIECNACHNNVEFPDDIQFLRREEFLVVAYPGAADRAICMGCHRGEGSMATTFYHVPTP